MTPSTERENIKSGGATHVPFRGNVTQVRVRNLGGKGVKESLQKTKRGSIDPADRDQPPVNLGGREN